MDVHSLSKSRVRLLAMGFRLLIDAGPERLTEAAYSQSDVTVLKKAIRADCNEKTCWQSIKLVRRPAGIAVNCILFGGRLVTAYSPVSQPGRSPKIRVV